MIGVIASMESEFAFWEHCTFLGEKPHGVFTYKRYDCDGIELVCGVCGTGKVSAAVCTQLMIEDYSPELIVNIGTAGSLGGNVHNKDVIVAEDSIQHDFDVSPFGWKRGELPELGTIDLPCDRSFVESAKRIDPSGHTIHFGRILSGDRVVVDGDLKSDLLSAFGGLCVEMEGAAVGQVCAMNHMPYAIIRGISDGDDEDQKSEFFSNIESVAEINGAVLLAALKEYEKSCGCQGD